MLAYKLHNFQVLLHKNLEVLLNHPQEASYSSPDIFHHSLDDTFELNAFHKYDQFVWKPQDLEEFLH